MRETPDKTSVRAGESGCPCVVWVSPGVSRPEVLLKGLANRGARVRVVADAPSVMVELAAGARAVVINEPQMVRRSGELLAAVRRYYPGVVSWRFNMIGPKGHPSLERMAANGAAVSPKSNGSPALESRSAAVAKAQRINEPPTVESKRVEQREPGAAATRASEEQNRVVPRPPENRREESKVSPASPPTRAPEGRRTPEPRPQPPAPLLTPEELEMLLAPLPEEDQSRVNVRENWEEKEEQK